MAKTNVKDLIIASEFAVLIAIMAQINVSIGPVPFTGQTLVVAITATILPTRISTRSVGIYLLLGSIGLPVFAGGHAGIHILLGPTGGFLLAFFLQAATTSSLLTTFCHNYKTAFIANTIGTLLTLVIGSIWLKVYTHLSWNHAFQAGFYPFFIQEMIKACLASFIGIMIYRILMKSKQFASIY